MLSELFKKNNTQLYMSIVTNVIQWAGTLAAMFYLISQTGNAKMGWLLAYPMFCGLMLTTKLLPNNEEKKDGNGKD